MASNVTRDHHNLRRNLIIGDNYIQNNVLDVQKGISIVDNGGTKVLSTVGSGGYGFYAITSNANSSGSQKAISVKYSNNIDITGTTLTAYGVDINMDQNADEVDETGVINMYGINIDIDARTEGTQTSYGMKLDISGADTNYGIECLSADRQLRLSYDGDSYLDITVANDSDTTIATGESGDLTLDVAGDMFLNAGGQQLYIRSGSDDFVKFDYGAGEMYMYPIGSTTEYLRFDIAANGVSIIETANAGIASTATLDIKVNGTLTLDSNLDIILDADGDNITMKAGSVGSGLDFIQSGTGDYTIKNLTSDKDIIFNVKDDDSDTEVMRLDGSASSLLMASGKKIEFVDTNEYISGDGTDLTIGSGNDATIDAGNDIILDAAGDNIDFVGSAGVSLRFLQGSSDWTMINLANDKDIIFSALDNTVATEVMRIVGAESSLLVASGKKIEFGNAGEHISGNGTDLTITSSADIKLDHDASDELGIYAEGDIHAKFGIAGGGGPFLRIYEGAGDTDDHFDIQLGAHGGTYITTTDAATAQGHLNIWPDGDLIVTAVDVDINASGDIDLDAGGDIILDAAGHVEFDGCGVGFDLVEPTYDSTTTVVDFRTGNKQLVTFDGGDILNLSMYFPATSGNFVVLIKQDGTGGRTITNYRTYDVDVGNVNAVRFPGAASPDLTDDANFVDIISVFWDADNFLAYGVASLDFDPT